jgi:acyl-[acyl-carrier-protein] desaturase
MRPKNEERLYRQYMEFFEKAERKRRWNVFEDIPWDDWKEEYASEEMALCAETFCGVEMYLPDYTSEGLNLVGRNREQRAGNGAQAAVERIRETG